MKNLLKYFVVILVLALIAGLIYWNKNKKHVIKDGVENAIAKKTDSLYFIHYDSSKIDEITGSAAFFNVSLQSDDVQKSMLKNTDSLPNAIFNVKVQEVSVTGLNIPGLLTKQIVSAGKITLIKPVIQVINTGAENEKPLTYNDSVALYKRILGSFKSIAADTIQISNGTVLMTNKNGKALTTLENINIVLNKFIIDSDHDYQNIISYFIKDIRMSIENMQLPESKNNTRVNIEHFVYDAGKKIIQVKNIKQYKSGNINPLTDLKNIEIDQLNTSAFILSHQLKAGIIKCDGGVVTIYKNQHKEKKKEKAIQFSSDLINEAMVQGINLGNTKIMIEDPSKQDTAPFTLEGVKFSMPEAVNLSNGSTLSELITDANWQLSIANFSFITKQKIYKIDVNNITLDNKNGNGSIGSLTVKPMLSEQAFVKQSPYQMDLYNLEFKKINLQGIDIKKLIVDNSLYVENVSVQPVVKIFNDRTIPFDTSSKIGKYPHQQLQQATIPLYIKKVAINNGQVNYTERGRVSGMKGTVAFANLNAVINNVTNVPAKIAADNMCVVNAKAMFMGKAKISTQWKLPLSNKDTSFTATGTLDQMDALALNPLIEPLAMASIQHGQIKKLVFEMKANDYRSTGKATLLYQDLKIEVLKKTDKNTLDTKGVMTFLANTLIKNNNPQNGNTREGKIAFERDIDKSFFNVLWKSVFNGVKKIAIGKK